MYKRLNVAVGVIINPQGEILIAKRQAHQHQGHCWEFPGGKIEQDESVSDAIKRELFEEVGLTVHHSEPLLEVNHDYSDKHVCLKVHKITSFDGLAIGKEGQDIRWVSPELLSELAWPDANQAIIEILNPKASTLRR